MTLKLVIIRRKTVNIPFANTHFNAMNLSSTGDLLEPVSPAVVAKWVIFLIIFISYTFTTWQFTGKKYFFVAPIYYIIAFETSVGENRKILGI